jgi:hypothetical protein
MTPSEMERLVARHLDGAMSLEEEEEFFIRVALDGELRRVLRAQRIVESALRKRSDAASLPPPSAREHLKLMLAAGTAGPAPTGATSPGIASPSMSALSAPVASLGTAMIGALGTLAVITFLSFSLSPTPRTVDTPPTRKPAHVRPIQSPVAHSERAIAPDPGVAYTIPKSPPPADRVSTRSGATSRPDSRTAPPAVTGSASRRSSSFSPLIEHDATTRAIAPRSDSMNHDDPEPVSQRSERDTIRLKVRLDMP